jgi:hypothetical protein
MVKVAEWRLEQSQMKERPARLYKPGVGPSPSQRSKEDWDSFIS